MLSAYFDTNVFDAIEKGDIPAEEVEAVRAALRRGEIVAHLSFSDVDIFRRPMRTTAPRPLFIRARAVLRP